MNDATIIESLTSYYFGMFDDNIARQFWCNINRLFIVRQFSYLEFREDVCVLDTDMMF